MLVNTEELGLLVNNDQVVVSSRKVAEVFSKRHDNVIQAIKNLEVPEDFGRLNFEAKEISVLHNPTGKEIAEYLMTRDGFTLLAMGFTGKKATQFKIKYIAAFNAMEQKLREVANGLSSNAVELYGNAIQALINENRRKDSAIATLAADTNEVKTKTVVIESELTEVKAELVTLRRENSNLQHQMAFTKTSGTITTEQYEQLRSIAYEVKKIKIAGRDLWHEYWSMLHQIENRSSRLLSMANFGLALIKAKAFLESLPRNQEPPPVVIKRRKKKSTSNHYNISDYKRHTKPIH